MVRNPKKHFLRSLAVLVLLVKITFGVLLDAGQYSEDEHVVKTVVRNYETRVQLQRGTCKT